MTLWNTNIPPPVVEKMIGKPASEMSTASPPVANKAWGSNGTKSAIAEEANPSISIEPIATARKGEFQQKSLLKIASLFDIKLQVYNGSLWFAKVYMVTAAPLRELGLSL